MTTTPTALSQSVQLPPPDPAGRTTDRRRVRTWVIAGTAGLVLAGIGALGVGALRAGDEVRSTISDVQAIVVDIGAGPITLTGTDADTVEVRSTSHGLFAGDARHDLVDGVLTVTAGGFGLDSYTEQALTVPAGVPVLVHTGVGDITATDLEVPSFRADAGASSIAASFRTAPDELIVNAGAAGNVQLTVPDVGYRIQVDSTMGSDDVAVRHDSAAERILSADTFVGGVTISPR